MAPAFVPLNDFEKGTVLDEGDAKIIDASFALWRGYKGDQDEVPALMVEFEDVDGAEYEQGYSAGRVEDFKPSDDGKMLEVVGKKKKTHLQSNFAFFMAAMIDAGFPAKQLSGTDIGCIVGTAGYLVTKTREFDFKGSEGKRETKILVFDSISALPGASGKKSAVAPADETVSDKATEVLTEILIEADGEIAKKDILKAALANDTLKDKEIGKKVKTGVLSLLKDDSFLKSGDGWTYDKGVVTME